MVCLLSEGDLADTYWPRERKEPLRVTQGQNRLEVTLQSERRSGKGGCWTERIFTLMNKAQNMSRVVIHMQLNDYGYTVISRQSFGLSSLFMIFLLHFSLKSVVNLVSDMMEYHRQQRSFSHPILVHCLGGTGR